MSIEPDDNAGDTCVPQAYTAVRIAHSEELGICTAMRNSRHFGTVVLVEPCREQLTLLYVPAEDGLVGGNTGSACAGMASGGIVIGRVGGPNCVRGG